MQKAVTAYFSSRQLRCVYLKLHGRVDQRSIYTVTTARRVRIHITSLYAYYNTQGNTI